MDELYADCIVGPVKSFPGAISINYLSIVNSFVQENTSFSGAVDQPARLNGIQTKTSRFYDARTCDSDVAYWFFDAVPSYNCQAEFAKCQIIHFPIGNLTLV